MTMSRYEIRNEYSLADPELYRAADKGDPEALLEGVAMAGLVGVLRQLGDLAEFAAEIFHNLHEEVMVTASRGHGLMIRVQQLETEVHFMEKSFLSQTDHSSFYYHAGVDWHPNLRINQNLVTQGDLPRFVMDFYEECRAPPRLFLLDKFDVAGAGACLKRYTDPSIFKVETTEMTADVQREKRIRKVKKKAPRWRNGENSEDLHTSHAKLHQLFLEERVENGPNNLSHRAKLRRRLNGFPFDSKSGNSYMEKLLNSPSPDHKVRQEVTEKSSPPLMLAVNDRESMETRRSPSSSPAREEVMLKPSIYEPNEVSPDDKICERANSCPSIVTDGIRFSLDKVISEKVISVDAESKKEDSLNGYRSDDITSEIDNYVDAPSTVESELDTDSELRLKSDFAKKNQQLICDANEDPLPPKSSDSHSTGDSTVSNEGNNSPGKEISSLSSFDSPSTSAENQQSEKRSPKRFPSADIPEVEPVDVSSYQKPAIEFFPVDQYSKPMVSDYTCNNTGAITDHIPDNDLTFGSDSEGVVGKCRLWGLESDETASTLAKEENKANLVIDPPSSPSIPDPELQLGDDTPRSSAGEHIMEEPNVENIPCVSTVSSMTDSSVTISADLLHENQSYCEDNNLGENKPSMLNMYVVLSQNSNCTSENTESMIPGKLEDEVPEVFENIPSHYPDIAHSGDNIGSTVSKGENLVVESDNKDLDVSTVAQKCSPCIMEASPGRTLEETSFANAETVDSEENHSNNSIDTQIASEIKLSNLASSSDWPPEVVDAHNRDVIPEEETSSISDTVENDQTALSTSPSVLQNTEISFSADLKSLNQVHKLSDESNSETEKTKSAHMSFSLRTASDYKEIDDVGLPVGINKLVKEQILCCEELENDKNCLSGSYTVSDLVEEVVQTEGFGTVFCNTTNNDNPKSEVSDSVLSHRDLEIEQECLQENGNHLSGPSLPTDYDIKESVLQEQIEIPQLPNSSEISLELSPLTPINQQMLDHDDHKDNDSASIMSLVDYANPPSASDIPRLSNHDTDFAENPKDSLGSNFPSINPFSETNQVNLDNLPPLPLPPVQWIMGKLQHASSTTEEEITKPEEFPREISPPNTSTSDVSSSLQEMNRYLSQISPKNTSKEKVVENSSSSLEATAMNGKIDLPTKIENNQPEFVTPTSDSESTSAAKADGVSNGSRAARLPRPHNPLIESVAAIDKSRLRKVTERVRPEIQKIDAKDSFLEQIRAKSLNLKPAVASRPSIRGPKTNLNVAAILEKANSIRQAFAGSDEDSEDSWSD